MISVSYCHLSLPLSTTAALECKYFEDEMCHNYTLINFQIKGTFTLNHNLKTL